MKGTCSTTDILWSNFGVVILWQDQEHIQNTVYMYLRQYISQTSLQYHFITTLIFKLSITQPSQTIQLDPGLKTRSLPFYLPKMAYETG